MSKPHRYLFGRLNINANYNEKEAFVRSALNKGNTVTYKTYKWGFYKLEDISESGLNFLTGYLIKYNDLDTVETVNEEEHSITDTQIENSIKSKSRFFLHIKSGLLIYHAAKDIGHNAFKNRFVEIFEAANDNFFVEAVIYSIEPEELNFISQLEALTIIKRVKINLHPSNPSNRDIWQETDERLKKLNVDSYTEIYTNREGSLAIDDEMKAKVYMADDGYGQATAKGILNGKEVDITTEDNPLYEDIPNNTTEPSTILSLMTDKIQEFFNRFK